MSTRADTALRLLIVDDRVEDAEALASGLRNAGIAVRPLRPESDDDLGRIIGSQSPDVVIAARNSQMLPFAQVMQRVADSGRDLPVVALVDTLVEADYLDAIQSGARAVALRHAPQQVLACVREAWADRDARRGLRRLEARVRETERRCDALIDSSRDPIAYIHEGMHIRANAAYLEMFGYDSFEDVEGISLLDMVAPQHVESFKALLKSLSKGEPPPPRHEIEARDISGNAFPASMEFTTAQYEGEPCLQVVFRRREELDADLVLELEELRNRDQVTGLLNRPAFLRAIEDAVDDAAQSDGQYGFLMLEPDHHQHLLADIGLDHADDLLAAVAEHLQTLIDADATVARYAGHTLAILLRGHDYHATNATAERLRAGFADHVFEVGERSSVITVSIGGVQVGEKIANVAQVLARATKAMESASGTGGNRCEVFDPSAVDRIEEERIQAWVARLRGALDNDGFVLHYQPVINLQGDNAAVYDVLLRLDGGDGELIAPGTFLQIAEDNDMLGEIDRHVAARAIAAIGQRLRAGHPTTLLVKISQASLDGDAFADFIGAQLAEHQVPGEYLVLQLPEAKVFTHLKATQAFAARIARFDGRFALEQFGVGLDSFQLLSHLQPHLLKLDRSFTDDLPNNSENQARIGEIAGRARQIGIRTIAEFVQDAASMSILFGADIDYVQGNFLAAASPGMQYDFE
ncbi:EAL domain-containing response regulator [Luteimonas terrae]|uniref:Diguanylate cyclase (GGDEF)-like protein/PAS domain S-box-containing protein n=1 Tax=Luteimonas terrae TaxID=1530191 RepID=A0ABU1XUQ3_9GAMM|nr:EAL domain-containing protein [Luteimonas terrae]MDR7192482.1 diguanylate cyclase (GGDEF)-like protein/PAS domain S-box-containing protein [Luteimonas terrae]